MAFKIKKSNREKKSLGKATKEVFEMLENKAQEEYGTSFKDLSEKEQLKIAKKVEKIVHKRTERM
jgi:hypothetical protein